MKQGCPQAIINCLQGILSICNWRIDDKQQKASTSLSHLEEEEFQFSTHSKSHTDEEVGTHSRRTYNQQQPNTYLEQQSVEVKLNLPKDKHPEGQPLADNETVETITDFNFKMHLEPSHQYYEVLESRTRNLHLYFQQESSVVLRRQQKSKVSIREVESVGSFKIMISYRLPCSYAYFSSISREMSSQLSSIIASHQTTEVLMPNLTMNHLQFKKFMLLEPRWFNYVKYVNSSSNSHWEVCLSVKGRPNSDINLKECDLFTVTCLQETSGGLSVNSYVEVDLKSNIRARKVVQRVCEEVANYFDSLWRYASQHYSEDLA